MIPRTVAVIGTGSIGSRHLDVLKTLPGVRPLAVPKRASRLAALRKGGAAVAADIPSALRAGASRVIVATDTASHPADAARVLAGRAPVLVEKPLAAGGAAARRLCAKARAARTPLFVACPLRFSDALNRFRAWLPRLGRIHSVRIECRSYLPDWRPGRPYRASYSARAAEGGVLRDLIHEIDYALWIFGRPASVQARLVGGGTLGIASEAAAHLSWTAPAGAVVSLELDYLSRNPCRWMRAAGERGTLSIDFLKETVRLSGRTEKTFSSEQKRDGMVRAQDLAFLKGGAGSPLSTGEEGAAALAVCDAARRAHARRREERVAYR